MRWEDLVGKTINRIVHKSEGLAICTDEEKIIFVVEGDCCSESWIDAINDTGAFPGKVLEASVCGAPEDTPRLRQDGLQESNTAYFYKLKTTRGYFDLTLYNTSNGYYGGELRWWSSTSAIYYRSTPTPKVLEELAE